MEPTPSPALQEIQDHSKHSDEIIHKGHSFIQIVYHLPTNCEACTKALWNVIRPPMAIECQREYSSAEFELDLLSLLFDVKAHIFM